MTSHADFEALLFGGAPPVAPAAAAPRQAVKKLVQPTMSHLSSPAAAVKAPVRQTIARPGTFCNESNVREASGFIDQALAALGLPSPRVVGDNTELAECPPAAAARILNSLHRVTEYCQTQARTRSNVSF